MLLAAAAIVLALMQYSTVVVIAVKSLTALALVLASAIDHQLPSLYLSLLAVLLVC
jgi:hypothetical protein